MDIARQNRDEAYESVKPDIPKRKSLILACLSGGEALTVTEIIEKLMRQGILPYFDRNYVAPRLSELREDGIVEVVGRKPSRTGRYEAIWKIAAEKETVK